LGAILQLPYETSTIDRFLTILDWSEANRSQITKIRGNITLFDLQQLVSLAEDLQLEKEWFFEKFVFLADNVLSRFQLKIKIRRNDDFTSMNLWLKDLLKKYPSNPTSSYPLLHTRPPRIIIIRCNDGRFLKIPAECCALFRNMTADHYPLQYSYYQIDDVIRLSKGRMLDLALDDLLPVIQLANDLGLDGSSLSDCTPFYMEILKNALQQVGIEINDASSYEDLLNELTLNIRRWC
jgi:hypothetical protein